jgi:hypothetical protein
MAPWMRCNPTLDSRGPCKPRAPPLLRACVADPAGVSQRKSICAPPVPGASEAASRGVTIVPSSRNAMRPTALAFSASRWRSAAVKTMRRPPSRSRSRRFSGSGTRSPPPVPVQPTGDQHEQELKQPRGSRISAGILAAPPFGVNHYASTATTIREARSSFRTAGDHHCGIVLARHHVNA